MSNHNNHLNKVTGAGLLVTLGIIFGDIGTSPLYVFKAIVGSATITEEIVLGGLSCIFWTLTLQTTIKYVMLTLNADNNGEGGIFALYALLKRMNKKWLLVPAIIGGSTLLADGLITPPISVASAIEGLKAINPEINTIPIIIIIITSLFLIQQFGTSLVGKFFGPVMLLWFLMLGTLGFVSISDNLSVLKAVNPYYAFKLLTAHPEGFWLLGAVFLCTTGAEALYSDLGHCGKQNIRVSWIFVKSMLLTNYFGQAAFLLSHQGELLGERNPFYALMPSWFLIVGICISTAATIVASQALISGSFTLINEAIRLNLWPKVKIAFPTDIRGQLYIPSANWLLCIGCIAVVLFFKESSHMEAAYGLSIVVTMIMTTILLMNFLVMKRFPSYVIYGLLFLYLSIELSFLVANLSKFAHGGWVTIVIASVLVFVMTVWYRAKNIMNRYVRFTPMDKHLQQIVELSEDKTIEKYATHLVYLTNAEDETKIEEKIIYSLLKKQPKKADTYWFVHINSMDDPYCMEYRVKHLVPGKVMRVEFNLGFRVSPRMSTFFREVVTQMAQNKEVDLVSRYDSLQRHNIIGDFRFVVMKKYLSNENILSSFEKLILDSYFVLKHWSLSEQKAFGLETSNVSVENAPLIIKAPTSVDLKRL